MERELLLTGIGGQGVQLAARIVAGAALREGREVMMFGAYGGQMRGGNTDSTVVVADAPISAPPVVSRAWSAIAMHHAYWPATRARLRPRAVVLVNESLFAAALDREAWRVTALPASDWAAEIGNPLGASLVMVGAHAALTGLVGIDSLVEAMREALPPYRRQHAAGNEAALRAGFERTPRGAAPAWQAD
jgi:Pyruvate/2-oxoacid:ferredoxin oxidoreductase gamma subunit